MQIKQVSFDKTRYIAPTWKQMGKLIFDLGKQILKTNQRYDWLISIAKGGWTWSRTLADYLDMDNMASVKAKLYEDIGKTKLFELEQALPAAVDITGKEVLLFDDVADSGKTLSAVRDYLIEAGAKSVETATLFYKPKSVLKPDFYSYKTSAWIVFPHEIREFINLTNKKFKKSDYLKLGLPKDQVKFFLLLMAS